MRVEKELTDDLIVALAVSIATGDGEKPAAGGWQGTPGQSTFVPYCVVHPLTGGYTTGGIDDNDSAELLYQISCYGATRAQCQHAAETVHPIALGLRPTLTSHAVTWVDDDMLGGSRRDDLVQPPQWVAVPRYRFYVAPKS